MDIELAQFFLYFFNYAPNILIFVITAFFVRHWARFEKLERQASYRQEDSHMIFKSLRACLEGLSKVGANGAVEDTLLELNAYIDKKAAGLPGNLGG